MLSTIYMDNIVDNPKNAMLIKAMLEMLIL